MKRTILLLALGSLLLAPFCPALARLTGPERGINKVDETNLSGLEARYGTSSQNLANVSAAYATSSQNLVNVTAAYGTSSQQLVTAQGQIGTTADLVDLARSAALDVTNGQAVTITDSCMLLHTVGTDATTNTITLADPGVGVAARYSILYNGPNSTNPLAIAKTGNWVSTAIVVPAGDAAAIVAVGTNYWAGK